MKKLFYLACCLTVALSLGCVAITYPTITDNDGGGSTVTNTNGKAHLIETTQTSQTVDGRRFELVSFVDQTAGGNQKLTSYQLELAASTSNFHSDTYCNPDWTGCAWLTNSYDPDTVPCTFSTPGVRLNLNCLSVSAIGLCFGSRPGECGRSVEKTSMTPADIQTILANGVPQGNHTLIYNLSNANGSVQLVDGSGNIMNPAFRGVVQAKINLSKNLLSFEQNSALRAQNMLTVANIAGSSFQSGSANITAFGVSKSVRYSLLDRDFYANLAHKF
ncbi:MAG: hypothetical protein ACRDGM_03485 [bacterium]